MTSRAPNRTLTPSRWILRLAPTDDRSQEQPRSQEGGRDPEHARLDVPRARDGVGQDPGQIEAEEGVALDGVVRRQRAEEDLHDEECDHDAHVLGHCTHGRRQREAEQWVATRRFGIRLLSACARRGTRPCRRRPREAGGCSRSTRRSSQSSGGCRGAGRGASCSCRCTRGPGAR